MTDSSGDSQLSPPQSELTAGQLLSRIARMISQASVITDITPDSVRQQLGLELTGDTGEIRSAAQLTPEWNYYLSLDPNAIGGPMFYLGFFPADPDAHPDMTSICEVDLDQFAAVLEGAGFDREPWIGEHGRRMGHYFGRDRLRVTIATRGEASAPAEKVTHDCILGIQAQ